MDNPNLISLLPHYFRKVKDFIALMETENIELGQLEGSMQQVYDNFFIQTADAGWAPEWRAWRRRTLSRSSHSTRAAPAAGARIKRR